MPFRQEDAAYMRRKAQQFRALADIETPVSRKLHEIAAELDAQADQIEKRSELPEPPNAA